MLSHHHYAAWHQIVALQDFLADQHEDVYAQVEYHILEASPALAGRQQDRLGRHTNVIHINIGDARKGATWRSLRDKV
jgi:SAM-dependent MidA family methyltransferase